MKQVTGKVTRDTDELCYYHYYLEDPNSIGSYRFPVSLFSEAKKYLGKTITCEIADNNIYVNRIID